MILEGSILKVYRDFLREARDVHTPSWQGVDISKRPEARMKEQLFVTLKADLEGMEDLAYYQEQIQPNLPWAEDHFQERVSGHPLNPGVQWAKWPWGHSADKFRMDMGPAISETDWAYLAGLIDGDGSITIREDGKPHLVVTQVDHDYLRSVVEKLSVGQLRTNENLSGLSDRPALRWQVSKAADLKWVLAHTLKYLKLKRVKAMEAFDNLPDFDMREVGNKSRDPSFNHNYMQRYWPKYAAMTDGGVVAEEDKKLLVPRSGIHFNYGDLDDMVEMLAHDPLTRQAYLPVWFPEDTGQAINGRKPCTLGYHFIMRNGRLNCVYYIRSCDIARHFRDDIYLTVRLQLWVLQRCRELDIVKWNETRMGQFIMHISSLHCFVNDWHQMRGDKR